MLVSEGEAFCTVGTKVGSVEDELVLLHGLSQHS